MQSLKLRFSCLWKREVCQFQWYGRDVLLKSQGIMDTVRFSIIMMVKLSWLVGCDSPIRLWSGKVRSHWLFEWELERNIFTWKEQDPSIIHAIDAIWSSLPSVLLNNIPGVLSWTTTGCMRGKCQDLGYICPFLPSRKSPSKASVCIRHRLPYLQSPGIFFRRDDNTYTSMLLYLR